MTVWVVNTVLDKTMLEKWGNVQPINQRYCYVDELDKDHLPRIFMRGLEEAVSAFEPNTDFVALVGDHAQISQLLVLLAHRHKSINILRYDKIRDDYFKVTI